jgi:hypothetical protein
VVIICLLLNVLRCVYIRSGVLYRKTTRLLLCGLKIWDLVWFINICWIFMEMDCDICYYIYVDVRWMLNCPVWGMLFLGNVWNLYYCRSIKCTHTTWWNLKYDVHKNRKKCTKWNAAWCVVVSHFSRVDCKLIIFWKICFCESILFFPVRQNLI